MKAIQLILILNVFTVNFLIAQDSDDLKERFIQELNSGNLHDGCTLMVNVISVTANSACFIPDPTISKVACAAAQILNASAVNTFDPNIPNPIMESGVIICKLSYASVAIGLDYTFEFTENQTEEIKATWNWLNTLEGSIQLVKYLSP